MTRYDPTKQFEVRYDPNQGFVFVRKKPLNSERRNYVHSRAARSLGVSTLLPERSAEFLVDAAKRAKEYPEDSLERREIIDDAIKIVRSANPELFRAPSERYQSANRAVPPEGAVHER